MSPARKAFESELRQMLVDAGSGKALLLKDCADRLLERARRVINEERTRADGVYPEEGGARIWKNGHTFLVPKDWNKGEWPLLNNKGYGRSKKSKERLLTNELDVLLDWDFVAATKLIQDLGTDIPLKEGEYMITGAVHLAMYEYRHELNKALRAMGAEEINFDEDCWFAQWSSAHSAWHFSATNGTLYTYSYVSYTNQVRAVSL